ncbi:MAG: hypothetical protein VYA34_02665 [Myxococcota bacterium]|nr:hypothetical protein [Myxococcota bacterium]
MGRRSLLVAVILLGLWTGSAQAGEVHAHHSHAALFIGATTHTIDDVVHHGITVGADYEYRLSVMDGLVGLGVLVDAAFFDETHLIGGPMVVVHPVGGLRFAVAPVIVVTNLDKANFGLRGSVGYDLHFGAMSVGPVASVDYANGHVSYVYGLAVGAGF